MVATFGSFRFDRQQRLLFQGASEVVLAPKTAELLACFLDQPNHLLTRSDLASKLWPNSFVEDHTLSVLIAELRKALGDNPKAPTYIETRARRGYRLISPVAMPAPAPAPPPPIEPKTPAAPPLTAPETHYALSGETNIAYQIVGDGPIDIVFVMGWVSHLEYFWVEPHFRAFLEKLSTLGRLILFDKRGTGLSDRVTPQQLPTLEQRMEDLRAVMRAANSQRAVLFGVSEGGPMSMLFAATYPEETLGLITFGSYARRLWDEDYPWGPKPAERNAYLEFLAQHWGEWWATYLRMGASPGSAIALTRMNAEIDVRPILSGIRVPTLILHRRDDRCLLAAESEFLASRIPNSTLHILQGDDHLPFIGDQPTVFDPLSRFLASLTQVPPPEVSLVTILHVNSGALPSMAPLRAILHSHRARPMSGTTEGLCFGFEGPVRAIRAAAEWLEVAKSNGHSFSAAIHTSECELPLPGPLTSAALEVTRYLLADALPYEIRVTRVVKDLTAGSSLPFTDRGSIRLNQRKAPAFSLAPDR
jgi:pimeloyl-ACP methyl ester carboxylesterase